VESEHGRDIRRDLAREIVTRGWGLLELRPMRVSLEEVFLQVTTEESAEPAAEPPPGEPPAPDGPSDEPPREAVNA
jgi:ABC-2 type transport system ATP-binding protein